MRLAIGQVPAVDAEDDLRRNAVRSDFASG